ncbi:hypothetical protein BX070DRAFT_229433 [Coemansia spiralis]|nr:hypothetical protein BX070DRAFT_229433 [Coemansia spiralis]
MNVNNQDKSVHIIFRYPFKRPDGFQPPRIKPAIEEWCLEEQVWRCLLALPGPDSPEDILAELEQDQVTFDWELLASTLQVSLDEVFQAASNLFAQHLGRSLNLVEDSIQFTSNKQLHIDSVDRIASDGRTFHTSSAPVGIHSAGNELKVDVGLQEVHNSEPPAGTASVVRKRRSSLSLDLSPDASDFDRAGLRSVESLGGEGAEDGSVSPVVNLNIATPDGTSDGQQSGGKNDSQIACQEDSDRSMQTASVKEPNILSVTSDMMGSQQVHRNASPPANDKTTRIAASYSRDDDQMMRQSMLAEAMGSRLQPAEYGRNHHASSNSVPQRQRQQQQVLPPRFQSATSTYSSSSGRVQNADSMASSSSFSDLSSSSLTESAMQDALISEAMNASTAMSSILGSRVFPWSRKKK